MRQLVNDNYEELTELDLPKLTTINYNIRVRAPSPPRSADLARARAHHAEPPLLMSWRVAARASGTF